MFRRRKDGLDGSLPPSDPPILTADPEPAPVRSFGRAGMPDTAIKPVSLAPRPAAGLATARSEPPRRPVEIPSAPRRAERPAAGAGEAKKLTVGRDICLNGQITACERLVVEGRVEAELSDCRVIEVAESGSFKGSAEVDTAEISGRFEGTLKAVDRLIIRSTGRVSGIIHYGRIEIEQGGNIAGEVKSLGPATGAADHTAPDRAESSAGTAGELVGTESRAAASHSAGSEA